MRAVFLTLLLAACLVALAETPSSVVPLRSRDPNVVPLNTSPPWWSSPEFDRKVTLVINSVDLDAAIDALGRAANISLVASGGSKARKKVSLNLREAPLRDVMLALANLYGLTWFRTGEVYTLTYVSASQKSVGPSLSTLKSPKLPKLPSPPSPYRQRTYRRSN